MPSSATSLAFEAKAYANQAKRLESIGELEDARSFYLKAANLFNESAKETIDEREKDLRQGLAEVNLKAAQSLKPRKKITAGPEAKDESPEDFERVVEKFIKKQSISWSDIGGLEQVKRSLRGVIGVQRAIRPEGVKVKTYSSILLYGPPGTGKTLLATAASNMLGATFFHVELGGIQSKWFGDSPKLIEAVYSLARKKAPSVIFFDEFDAIATKRGDDQSDARRSLLGSVLSSIDGFSGKASKDFVLTFAATNTPWDLDEAALSRFGSRVYISLPDPPSREAILRILLEKSGYKVTFNYEWLVEQTENFSGRDLDNLCTEAISKMQRDGNPLLYSWDKLEDLQDAVLKIRPLTQEDFEIALSTMKPTSTPQSIERFNTWEKERGSGSS
jgi:katanin p60 ATPase-containing subunit A1